MSTRDPATTIASLRAQVRSLRRQVERANRDLDRERASVDVERDLVRRAFLRKAAECLLQPSERFLDAVVMDVARRLPPGTDFGEVEAFVSRHRPALLTAIRARAIERTLPVGAEGDA